MRTYDECKTYVDYWVSEHRRLHRLLRQVRRAVVGSIEMDPDVWRQSLIQVLRDLRDTLQCHFADEEGSGCLDQAVSFRPALSADMKRLEEEHPRLLAQIDRLIAQVEDGGASPAEHVAVAIVFDELCQELDTHETAENNILRQGFGANLETASSS